ncbi:methyltransferase [Streptomyces sp. NBC_00354]|uniref:methyltransferase n=1 Tax=Streptomyces sp. NBC_00354 TaxID=2975723 RepID=UPI002E26C20E
MLYGDFASRTRGRRFDLVLANPPYVLSPDTLLSTGGAERAGDTGPTGRLITDRVCATADAMLRPGGVLLMVHSAMCGPRTTVRRLERAALSARVVLRASVRWGPVLRGCRAWLESRGLAGEISEWEELVIIRAQRA